MKPLSPGRKKTLAKALDIEPTCAQCGTPFRLLGSFSLVELVKAQRHEGGRCFACLGNETKEPQA